MIIGVFGGAFDPVHMGHTVLAEKVYGHFKLDRFIFMPSKTPPHKTAHSASAQDRLKMLQLAIKSLDGNFEVSDFEINSQGVSYTFDTMKKLRSIYPADELFFITGSDIFATIKSWKNWKELLQIAKFIVVQRAGFAFDDMFRRINTDLTSLNGQIMLFNDEIPEISSTIIRNDIDENIGVVGKEVLEYIKSNGIYINPKEAE